MDTDTEFEIEDASTAGDDLDADGFPISGDESEPKPPPIEDPLDESSSFASDFYRCGSDWSRLIEKKESKSLVQRDLFQVWGIKKPAMAEESKARVSSSNQRDLFEVWGIEKPRVSVPARKRARKEDGNGSGFGRARSCPFYKKIPGTPFTVDAFRYGSVDGCSAYFLSHFHYDHYGGLSKKWSHGPIYCTPLTARLVKMCLGVNPLHICPLELDIEHDIEGIKVTMLEANHCPGAALIHFRLRDERTYLHTGDFRACNLMQSHPLLASQHINVLYLDTTYCNPRYRFPPKEDVVSFVVRITRDFIAKHSKALIVVGAYSIGKEQVYIAISHALGLPIYTNSSRRRILQSFGWPELSGKLCTCGDSSALHVLPLSSLRHENLLDYMKTYKQRFTAVLAFRPTGWTYSQNTGNQLDLIKPTCKGNITIYGVPYSEHSSFPELENFVKFLRPDKIIPTVNVGNAATRDKMQSYFREWLKAL
ncbi:uncharacterized protein A4U43_C09F15290 [Asparagus officinalis]|uniref:DNA repair metallo-beta-lactamase domain-containing protein n=1 Tax=Asparagus officinalis TaxID=4686 RepID=A0A5P1E9L7_ASPOF|nr:DNA cross-link repair protein SNM1 [Asparagus officinalis]ONK58653.1 uncharacterized protein A4U43_C09F15290 [Asparagus officinalis]